MSKAAMLNVFLRQRELTLVADGEVGTLAAEHHLKRLLEAYRIDCVIDVGANLGQFRDFMVNRVGWTGPVISFEPVDAYFRTISARAGESWRCFPYALGNESSEKRITVFDSPGLASLRDPDLQAMRELLPHGSVEIESGDMITVRRLADVFGEVTRGLSAQRVLLKTDTQGYDLEVFRGAAGVLDRISAIHTEVSFLHIYHEAPYFAETISEMGRAGYEVSGMFPVMLDRDLRAIEFDCVLVSPARRDSKVLPH